MVGCSDLEMAAAAQLLAVEGALLAVVVLLQAQAAANLTCKYMHDAVLWLAKDDASL